MPASRRTLKWCEAVALVTPSGKVPHARSPSAASVRTTMRRAGSLSACMTAVRSSSSRAGWKRSPMCRSVYTVFDSSRTPCYARAMSLTTIEHKGNAAAGGAALAATAGLAWGAMFPVAKHGLRHVDAFHMTSIRYRSPASPSSRCWRHARAGRRSASTAAACACSCWARSASRASTSSPMSASARRGPRTRRS